MLIFQCNFFPNSSYNETWTLTWAELKRLPSVYIPHPTVQVLPLLSVLGRHTDGSHPSFIFNCFTVVLLVSASQQCESAVSIHISPPSWASLPLIPLMLTSWGFCLQIPGSSRLSHHCCDASHTPLLTVTSWSLTSAGPLDKMRLPWVHSVNAEPATLPVLPYSSYCITTRLCGWSRFTRW